MAETIFLMAVYVDYTHIFFFLFILHFGKSLDFVLDTILITQT